MTPQVYENLEQLTYGELLTAIENIKEKMYQAGVKVEHADMQYYIALMQELDNRQKD
jgi:hypothetical protein